MKHITRALLLFGVLLISGLAQAADGKVKVKIQAPKENGVYVITASIDSKDMHFHDWVETIIEVK